MRMIKYVISVQKVIILSIYANAMAKYISNA